MSAHRRLLALTFFFGSLGTGAELLLMEHTEGVWQIVPLVLIALGALVLAVLTVTPGPSVLRTFRLLMLVFAMSGIAGSILHFDGNIQFERELDPEASGFALFRAAMQGATPALAPGTMILLGAIGFGYSRLSEPE